MYDLHANFTTHIVSTHFSVLGINIFIFYLMTCEHINFVVLHLRVTQGKKLYDCYFSLFLEIFWKINGVKWAVNCVQCVPLSFTFI